MEQKTNPSGEQAATQAPQPTAWIERVRALADELGNELDNRKSGEEDRRGFILVAVDGKGTVVIDLRDNEGDDGQADDQEQTQEEADGE